MCLIKYGIGEAQRLVALVHTALPLTLLLHYELDLSKISKNEQQTLTRRTQDWALARIGVIKAQLVVRTWDFLVSQLFKLPEGDLPLITATPCFPRQTTNISCILAGLGCCLPVSALMQPASNLPFPVDFAPCRWRALSPSKQAVVLLLADHLETAFVVMHRIYHT